MLTSTLSANLHLNYIVGIINQRLYLLNQLRRQGLDINGLAKVFLSVVVARFLYALSAFSGMITVDYINRINAVFCKAKKWGLTNTVPSVEEFCENADQKLFKEMMWSHNCLHTLLPPVRYTSRRNMRERGNHFQLPIAKTKFFKNSFMMRCLYNYVECFHISLQTFFYILFTVNI